MTSEDVARPRSTTALAALTQAVGGGLGWSLLPPLMVQISEELQVSHTVQGMVWAMAPLGIAFAAPMGGAAADRIGPRWVLGIAMLVGALACAARALCHTPFTLGLSMFVFGLHMGLTSPSIPKALAAHVPSAWLARAQGAPLLAYMLSTALTNLIAGPVLVPLFGGWREVMVAAAIAMAVTAVLWMAFVRDRGGVSKNLSPKETFALAKVTNVRRVAYVQFLLFGGYLALLGLLPRTLVERGLTASQAGVAVAVWMVAAGCANLLGPWTSDRLGKRRPIFIGGGILAGAALVLVALLPVDYAMVLLALSALGRGSFAPLVFTLPFETEGVGEKKAGAATGLLMLFGLFGGFMITALAGVVAGRVGTEYAIMFIAFTHVAIAIPGWMLQETGGGIPAAIPEKQSA